MSSYALLPDWVLADASAMPGVCRRHGRPAVARRRVSLWSHAMSPSVGAFVLFLFGAPAAAIGHLAGQRIVQEPGRVMLGLALVLVLRGQRRCRVAGWPLCPRCVGRMRLGRALVASGGGALMLSIAAMVRSIEHPTPVVPAFVAAVAGVVLVGFGLHEAGAMSHVRARLVRGGWAMVVKPHPAFAAALAAPVAPGEHGEQACPAPEGPRE